MLRYLGRSGQALAGHLANATIRFGAFEVFPTRRELRKHGIRIKLPDQSFTILLALLESPEFTVSREELRKKVWDDKTNVDFDHGLNAAVNRLREALGDSSAEPKFIETLPRRGYRFVGVIESEVVPVEVVLPKSEPERPRWGIWAAIAMVPLAGLGGGWCGNGRRYGFRRLRCMY